MESDQPDNFYSTVVVELTALLGNLDNLLNTWHTEIEREVDFSSLLKQLLLLTICMTQYCI